MSSRDPSPSPSASSSRRKSGIASSLATQAFSSAASFINTHRRNLSTSTLPLPSSSSSSAPTPSSSSTTASTPHIDPEDIPIEEFENNLPHDAEAGSSSGGFTSWATSAFTSNLQDRLFGKILSAGGIPAEYSTEHYSNAAKSRVHKERPPLSISIMGANFRRFNARVGVVFVFQHRLFRLLSWKEPSHTLSFLAVYTFLCIDPTLIVCVPFVCILLFVMVPCFIARHPPPKELHSARRVGHHHHHHHYDDMVEPYNAHGGPIAPPVEVKAVGELSKEFFRNLRDLQNTMDDFSNVHDSIIRTIGPPTNFSNERLSSGVFLGILAGAVLLFLLRTLVPWRFLALYHGYLVFALTHPLAKPYLLKSPSRGFREKVDKQAKGFGDWAENEFVLDEAPERREVEIFELQRKKTGGEWEGWLFSSTPYEAKSPARMEGQRPRGCRFFEDVRAPEGWEFVGKGWSVDLNSEEWVRDRCIEHVIVEREGERWVYDSEDEGSEWRRRRWIREVQRKRLT